MVHRASQGAGGDGREEETACRQKEGVCKGPEAGGRKAGSVPGAEARAGAGRGWGGAWGQPRLPVLETWVRLRCGGPTGGRGAASGRRGFSLHPSEQVVWLLLFFFFFSLLCSFSYFGESLLRLPSQHSGPQASGVRGYTDGLGLRAAKPGGLAAPKAVTCHTSQPCRTAAPLPAECQAAWNQEQLLRGAQSIVRTP